MNQGGKGANQAVAIKRLGGNLIFMAKLGNDVLGRQSVGYFKRKELIQDILLSMKILLPE